MAAPGRAAYPVNSMTLFTWVGVFSMSCWKASRMADGAKMWEMSGATSASPLAISDSACGMVPGHPVLVRAVISRSRIIPKGNGSSVRRKS